MLGLKLNIVSKRGPWRISMKTSRSIMVSPMLCIVDTITDQQIQHYNQWIKTHFLQQRQAQFWKLIPKIKTKQISFVLIQHLLPSLCAVLWAWYELSCSSMTRETKPAASVFPLTHNRCEVVISWWSPLLPKISIYATKCESILEKYGIFIHLQSKYCINLSCKRI